MANKTLDRCPVKRRPRPRRDTFPSPGLLDVLPVLVRLRAVHETGAAAPAWCEGDDGRPQSYPPVVELIFGIIAWHFGSMRSAERELRHPNVWATVREPLHALFPGWIGLRPGSRPPDRFSFARARGRYGWDDAVFDSLWETALAEAVETAQAMGMLREDGEGSLTSMSPLRIVSGDGVAIRSLTDFTANDRQVDPETGEIVGRRYEPDAGTFTTGDGDRVTGTKWVATRVHNQHEDETIILTISNVRDDRGGEAAIGVRDLLRIADLAPGMQGAAWDMALRGKHIDELLTKSGLQTIAKVAAEPGGKVKTRNMGRYAATRHGEKSAVIEVFAIAGAAHILVPIHGELVPVRLLKKRVRKRGRAGRYRVYTEYAIPDAPEVPEALRRRRLLMRNNGRDQRNPKLSRTEVLRTVVEADGAEWKTLHHGRPGSESTNSWLKDRLPKHRAPCLTIRLQRVHFLCAQVYRLARALIAFRHRTGRFPPGLLIELPMDQVLAATA